jgi:hypothetical protein
LELLGDKIGLWGCFEKKIEKGQSHCSKKWQCASSFASIAPKLDQEHLNSDWREYKKYKELIIVFTENKILVHNFWEDLAKKWLNGKAKP